MRWRALASCGFLFATACSGGDDPAQLPATGQPDAAALPDAFPGTTTDADSAAQPEAESGAWPETAPAPWFEPDEGIYPYLTPVTIHAGELGDSLYFTLNGTPATAASKRYAEPIKLESSLIDAKGQVVVCAVATSTSKQPSANECRTYGLEPGLIVHFRKPASWPDAFAYYWGTTPDNLAAQWPGTAMTAEGDDWYYAVVPGQTAVKLLFNATDLASASGPIQRKTADLEASAEDWYEGNWVDKTDWDQTVMGDRFRGRWWGRDPNRRRLSHFAFPGGRYKALILSFDDGNLPDRDFVKLLNQYQVRGSFNLDSGLLGDGSHVEQGELGTLYAGHEIAGPHGAPSVLARAIHRCGGYRIRGAGGPVESCAMVGAVREGACAPVRSIRELLKPRASGAPDQPHRLFEARRDHRDPGPPVGLAAMVADLPRERCLDARARATCVVRAGHGAALRVGAFVGAV